MDFNLLSTLYNGLYCFIFLLSSISVIIVLWNGKSAGALYKTLAIYCFVYCMYIFDGSVWQFFKDNSSGDSVTISMWPVLLFQGVTIVVLGYMFIYQLGYGKIFRFISHILVVSVILFLIYDFVSYKPKDYYHVMNYSSIYYYFVLCLFSVLYLIDSFRKNLQVKSINMLVAFAFLLFSAVNIIYDLCNNLLINRALLNDFVLYFMMTRIFSELFLIGFLFVVIYREVTRKEETLQTA